MKSDFEMVPAVAAAAGGRVKGGELFFRFPEVLKAIEACTAERIAVLGVELLEARPDGYRTERLSGYDQRAGKEPESARAWPLYVAMNNSLAADFVRENPGSDAEVYLLTTASWGEFLEARRVGRQ